MFDRIASYEFEKCSLVLFQDKGVYWVIIRPQEPGFVWELITPLTQCSAKEIFALAELEVMKIKLMIDLRPAFLIEIDKKAEKIAAMNKRCNQLIGNDIIGSLVLEYMDDKKHYQNFINTVKNIGHAHQSLDVLNKGKNPLRLKAEGRIIKSPFSQMQQVYIAFERCKATRSDRLTAFKGIV